ncbi:hypothetical protein [Acinetobacter johnsonii]|uniref:hypothetical protein n=1 Tax=Acinetobacter johnsonii TaxID=40214 RepID=UPI003AF95EE9
MNKKISTVRRGTIIFLSLLTVLVISLLIYGYDSMHDPEKVKARLYACGKFGDQHMLIDKQYLLFGRVTYQGVNYWGKNIKKEHEAKGCDDQIQSIALKVKWPEMTTSSEGFRLGSEYKNDITIALNQRSVWKEEWGSKNFFNEYWLLKEYLRKGMFSGGEEVSGVWIDETKTFNSDLGLYEIEVKSDDGVGKKVYWQERKGKGVSLTIKCLYFKVGATSCEFNTHQPNYGFNTSYIKIDFHSELLPHWQEIYQDAEQLINSFNTGEKQNEAS